MRQGQPMTTVATPPVVSQVSSDDSLYEIIDGQRVELPPTSPLANMIGSYLHGELYAFVKASGWGRTAMETLFRLPLAKERSRRPDVACISFDRWPKDRPYPMRDDAWDVVPDLAVEVVSPTNEADEILEKVDEYFRAGVRLVWVVYPRFGQVHVYRSLSDIHAVGREEILEGGDVLPGFRLALTELFRGVASAQS